MGKVLKFALPKKRRSEVVDYRISREETLRRLGLPPNATDQDIISKMKILELVGDPLGLCD